MDVEPLANLGRNSDFNPNKKCKSPLKKELGLVIEEVDGEQDEFKLIVNNSPKISF